MQSTRAIELGLGIAVLYLVVHVLFDGVVAIVWGFPDATQPIWRDALWWTDIVNAVLIGYVPAALRVLRSGLTRDLEVLRPHLRYDDEAFARARDAITGPGGPLARIFAASGVAIGIAIVYLDPRVSMATDPSLANPKFLWALLRSALFVGLVTRLVDADFRATRDYAALVRDVVVVDLLDVGALAVVARRGQRSVLTWALFAFIFSLFWLGDSAAQGNMPLLVLVLALATAAYFVPLIGLRRNIRAAKEAELGRLRNDIRRERHAIDSGAASGPATADPRSPRLANLVSYYQLIQSTREWPIDAGNLVRLALYIVLGLGSWLGGALVERVVDAALGE